MPLSTGKCCGHDSVFIFDRIIVKLAGTKDRLKFSDEFDLQLDRNICFGVTRPVALKILPIDL